MTVAPIKKTYNGRTVLDLPALELKDGVIYALIGANGSGKSTLARILAGTELSDSGESPLPEEVSVAYMPQKNFPFRMSVRKNILLGLNDPVRADELMTELGLFPLAEVSAKKLSGGETAKMALARLLIRPSLLTILDEPTAAMDMESTLSSERLIRRSCAQSGGTMIVISHSYQQARRLADEVLFLHDGRLIEQGSLIEHFARPVTEEFRRFLDFFGG